jgi:hypothetical protein
MKAGESPDGLLMRAPENRVYVSVDRAEAFIRSFLAFSHGLLVSDDARAPGIEIGPACTFRRIRINSRFGKLMALVTNGHLPFPCGRKITGYEVANLGATLAKAKAAGVVVLPGPSEADQRKAAIIEFSGGYIAEIHSRARSRKQTTL